MALVTLGQRPANGTMLAYLNAANSALVSSSTETHQLGTAGVTLGANTLAAGSILRVTLFGTMGTKGTSAGAFTVKAYLGGVAIISQDIAPAASLSAQAFKLVLTILVRTAGGAGTAIGLLSCESEEATLNDTDQEAEATALVLNAATVLSVTFKWTTSDASNTVTVQGGFVELFQP